MSTRLILPILNKNASLFKGPLLYLSDKVSIETMSSEDFGLISRDAHEEYSSLLPRNVKIVNIKDVDAADAEDVVRVNSTIISFVFNYLKESSPISLSYAVQITKNKTSKLDKIIDIPISADAYAQRKYDYKLKKGTLGSELADFYKVIVDVYRKYSNILLTLDRFNSTLWRKLENDRIVDITIALESLIDGNSELQYRFSLYNSYAAEADSAKRGDVFKTLKALYNARSSIVHGSALQKKEYDKKIKPIVDDWDNVIKISANAIAYQLFYLYKHGISDWYLHQEKMALGSESRFI